MRPTYNPDQQGFDFGDRFLLEDVCTIFDIEEFPNVSLEDVCARLRCRSEHAIVVYRKCFEIWETYVDQEIVNELRNQPNTDPMSPERIAIVLGQTTDEVEEEIRDALNSLGYAFDCLENAA